MKNLEINFCIIFSIRGHQWGEGARAGQSRGHTQRVYSLPAFDKRFRKTKMAEAWSDGGHDRMYRGSNQVFHRKKS